MSRVVVRRAPAGRSVRAIHLRSRACTRSRIAAVGSPASAACLSASRSERRASKGPSDAARNPSVFRKVLVVTGTLRGLLRVRERLVRRGREQQHVRVGLREEVVRELGRLAAGLHVEQIPEALETRPGLRDPARGHARLRVRASGVGRRRSRVPRRAGHRSEPAVRRPPRSGRRARPARDSRRTPQGTSGGCWARSAVRARTRRTSR